MKELRYLVEELKRFYKLVNMIDAHLNAIQKLRFLPELFILNPLFANETVKSVLLQRVPLTCISDCDKEKVNLQIFIYG